MKVLNRYISWKSQAMTGWSKKGALYFCGPLLALVGILLLFCLPSLLSDYIPSLVKRSGKKTLSLESIEGTFFSGMEMKNFFRKKKRRILSLGELEVSYENLLKFVFSQRVQIYRLQARQIFYSDSGDKTFKLGSIDLSERTKVQNLIPDNKLVDTLQRYSFHLRELLIEDAEFVKPQWDFRFKIDKAQVKNLSLASGGMALEAAHLKGDLLDISFVPRAGTHETGVVDFQGMLHAGFLGSLRRAVPLGGTITVNEGIISFSVRSFDGQVRLFSDDSSRVHLVFDDFNPNLFFDTAHPVSGVNIDLILGYVQKINAQFMVLKAGQLKYEGHEYKIVPEVSLYREGEKDDVGKRYEFSVEAFREKSSGEKQNIKMTLGTVYDGKQARVYTQIDG